MLPLLQSTSSVGVMQERRMHIHFNEDATVIHFPSDHPVLAGLSFQACPSSSIFPSM